MLKKIIYRPVLATVISIFLLILGLVAIFKLPIGKFPQISPPTVEVKAKYPGASAEVVSRSVAPPLENAINGVEGMDYINSTASDDGSLTISVVFKLGIDADQAAVNVQNRVSQAISMLPAEVNQIGVSTMKKQNSQLATVTLYSESPKMDELFLENYSKINIVPELKRIKGVGDVMLWGNKDYAMRIWLDPRKMSAYGVSPEEVKVAIDRSNKEAAPGKFGENSEEKIEYTIKYEGKFTEESDYEDIIIRATNEGSSLKLKDVARVEFGSYTNSMFTAFGDKPGIMVSIYQTIGGNANDIAKSMNESLEKLSKTFPPGVKYTIMYSVKESLDVAVEKVISTLFEAFILVFIVVFIFLQDFRSTLIPAISVPVSIVGTFFFIKLFGFSINMLTLFALVLAIGIVVDDAIVVVEAVHAKMHRKKLPAKDATISAISEITGAIFSITLVMAAVFVPVSLIDGPVGVFYQQFALTLAVAILISAINALTLSPALSALILKNNHVEGQEKTNFKTRFFKGFNAGFDRLTNRYGSSILFLIKRKSVAIGLLVILFVATIVGFVKTPTGFIPNEDQNFLMILVNTPPGTSLQKTNSAILNAKKIITQHPAVENITSVAGMNVMTFTASASSGVFYSRLKPSKIRGEIKNIDAIVADIQQKLSSQSGVSFLVMYLPTVEGYGNSNGLDISLLDKGNHSLKDFGKVGDQFMSKMRQLPEIGMVYTTFNVNFPQYELKMDKLKAKQFNLETNTVLEAIQAYYGSMQASDFTRFGKYYRVVMQAAPDQRKDMNSFEGITLKNQSDQQIPLTSVVSLEQTYGPEIVEHFNLFNTLNIIAMPAKGYSTGQAMEAVEKLATNDLPIGYAMDWKGISREEKSSSGQTSVIFMLSMLFVFFILAAQYESYILPFAVLLSVPTGLIGTFVGINMAGIANNIYVQVAMIMLIGLLAKNSILIVEFAKQKRESGGKLIAAAIQGSKARLRPILMTSLAFIAGLLPLLFATGPAALGNHSIGFAAVFGMLFGTVFGVFLTPVLFVIFQYLQEKVSSKKPAKPISLNLEN